MAPPTASCESGFLVLGLVDGEERITPTRIVATLVTLTVTSAWFSSRKVERLCLFFAHWLSGVVAMLGYVVEDILITLCWTGSNLENFIKTIKFFELAAFNMLAITNLAICVNLALIVLAHRTLTRVKSVSSLPVILLFLGISVTLAAASVPFWDAIVVFGTIFGIIGSDEKDGDVINVSYFCVEFFVGGCMFVIVAWLLLFRVEEIKECWKVHRRIRYYFGLTLVGTAVNLGVGICGLVNVLRQNPPVLIWGWMFRYIHIALDTIVLHGALTERNMNEHGAGASSGMGGLSSGQPVSGRCSQTGSGGSNNTSRHVTITPLA